MSIGEFFIKRPVFATVLNFFIVVLGVVAFQRLTVREYPNVVEPILHVETNYPDASAEVVEADVTFPLEDALAGVEGLKEISSASQYGYSGIKLRFNAEVKLEVAISQVRERVARARPGLPDDIKEPEIRTNSADSRPFMWLGLSSESLNSAELRHIAEIHIKNQLRNIKGVAQVVAEGPAYLMNITLDRLKMYALGVNPDEVADALRLADRLVPAGKYQDRIPITLDISLASPKEFESIVVKKTEQGPIYLKNLAEVQLATDTSQLVRMDGKPGAWVSIVKSNEGNPLTISAAVRQLLPYINKKLPESAQLEIYYDSSIFISESLANIRSAIIEAVVLVMLIIFLFLRNLRSSLIPLVTIPVSLIGTLAIMSACSFSINTITLLALVLAVGLVVDDAIVVLENIHRHIHNGLSPLQAAVKGSREIGFAIIAMTFTLASVYAPFALIHGIIGQLFIEFALTLAGAVLISGIVALSLSPVMCSRFLKNRERIFFPRLEQLFVGMNTSFVKTLEHVINWPKLVAACALVLLVGSIFLFVKLPKAVAPTEDRGFVGAYIGIPTGMSQDDFNGYLAKVEEIVESAVPERDRMVAQSGVWGGNVQVALKDRSKRSRSASEIVEDMRKRLEKLESVEPHVWSWDNALPGLDSGGNDTMDELIVDVSTTGSYKELFERLEALKKACESGTVLKDAWHDIHLDNPGFTARIDQHQVTQLGLSVSQVARAMQVMFHEMRPTEFHKDTVRYSVVLKGGERQSNIDEIYVTNAARERISLGSLVTLEPVTLPSNLQHINQMRAATFHVKLGEGIDLSKGRAFLDAEMKKLFPEYMSARYSGAAERQKESSSTMLWLFAMALVFIFCVLASQFESFVDPLVVMLTVPLACAGALLALYVSSGSINIFTQLGLVTLIGLISKHGILLVEFANQARKEGMNVKKAMLQAASLRFQPILMTTAAMIVGAVPLVISFGAGAESRRAIGLVLVGGLALGTVLTLFVIPTIYVLIKSDAKKI